MKNPIPDERERLHLATLEQLLAAVHADDPRREILVRIGDAIREAQDLAKRTSVQAARTSDPIAERMYAKSPAQAAGGGEGWPEQMRRLKYAIDHHLNDALCEMKPDYDDSMTGFNEAWDIVRKLFADPRFSATLPQPPQDHWPARDAILLADHIDAFGDRDFRDVALSPDERALIAKALRAFAQPPQDAGEGK